MAGGLFPDRKTAEDSSSSQIPAEAQSLYQQASELSHQGKTEDAIHFFKQAIDIAPDYILALHDIGNCLHNLGRSQEASVYYNRALQEIGNRLYEIGRHEESMGRYWVAIDRYEEAGNYYNREFSHDPAYKDAPGRKIRNVKRVEPEERELQ